MTKSDIKAAIKEDKDIYFGTEPKKRFFHKITSKDFYLTGKYIIYARLAGYYKENRSTLKNKILCIYYMRKKNKLGIRLHIDIAPSFFGRRIIVWHGNFVANYNAKIGDDCQFHGNNCLGSKNLDGTDAPQLGNKVDMGVGANAIGNIKIADEIKIGANSIVTKSFDEKNIVIAGVPAVKIK